MRDILGAGYDFVKINDKYWFVHTKYNALCSATEDGEVSDIAVFPGYELVNEDKALFGKLVHIDKSIICVPFMADDIAVFDIEKRCFNMIKLENCGIEEINNQVKFNCVFKNNNYLYMFGCTYSGIVRLNLETFEVDYNFDCIKMIDEIDEKRANKWYFTDAVQYDDRTILLTVGQLPIIVEFDIEKNTTRIHRISCSMKGFWGIKKIETKLYIIGMSPNSGNIIVWDYETGNISEIKVAMDREYDVSYSHIFICSEKVYLLPFDAKYLYTIDTNSGEAKIDNLSKDIYSKLIEEKKISTTLAAKIIDDELIFITAGDYKWHKYNLKKECLDSFMIRITNKQYIERVKHSICKSEIANKGYIFENVVELDEFINYFVL